MGGRARGGPGEGVELGAAGRGKRGDGGRGGMPDAVRRGRGPCDCALPHSLFII